MVTGVMPYIGRFAPSPTGPLHAGSLVAALASWLDARAHGGQWLVRLEDVDTPRCVPGADRTILGQLAACGLRPDEAPVWQSQRSALYQWALDVLVTQGLAYPCTCSRKDIELALQAAGRVKPRHGELIYPGTCRPSRNRPHGELGGWVGGWAAVRSASCPPPAAQAPPLPTQNASPPSLPRCAWRLRTDIFMPNKALDLMDIAQAATESIANSSTHTVWRDRRLGPQQQDVAQDVGDFVLKRADGCYTYQLAVVVDDAAQNITHVVRGEDLTDNTARQMVLQQALGLPTPTYLHTPLVRGENGEKLSKQNGAQALDTSTPEAAAQTLALAARQLELPVGNLSTWVAPWKMRYGPH